MNSASRQISNTFSAFISAVLWIVVAVMSCLVFFLGCILFLPVSLFDPTRAAIHHAAGWWGKTVLFAARPIWACRVEGREFIEKGRPYVVVSNHQSMLDILILLAVLPLHFKFMAKKELFSVPVIGWHMALADYIPVDRRSVQSGKKALLKAHEWLSRKVSILFFPEGTRSVTGDIQAFKEGAFRAAKETGVQILPVVLDGMWNAFPKRSWKIKNKARFYVSILKPVRIAKNDPAAKNMENIRAEMAGCLKVLRKRQR